MALLLVGAIAIIAAVLYGGRVVDMLKKPVSQQSPSPAITVLSGNPIARDSDNDGVMDWQEIAANLDPYDPETATGTPDREAYRAAAANLDPQAAASWDLSSDTDKISYTIFDKVVSQTNESGNIDTAVQVASAQELYNYIASLAPAERYTAANVPGVAATSDQEQAYKKTIASIGSVSIFDNAFQASLSSYLTNGSDQAVIAKKVAAIKSALEKMRAVPVPESIRADQIANFNALDGFAQVIAGYDPQRATDPIYQFAHATLLKMYEWAMINHSAAILNHYGDPQGQVINAAIKAVRGTP